jgi:hypothetical protein
MPTHAVVCLYRALVSDSSRAIYGWRASHRRPGALQAELLAHHTRHRIGRGILRYATHFVIRSCASSRSREDKDRSTAAKGGLLRQSGEIVQNFRTQGDSHGLFLAGGACGWPTMRTPNGSKKWLSPRLLKHLTVARLTWRLPEIGDRTRIIPADTAAW